MQANWPTDEPALFPRLTLTILQTEQLFDRIREVFKWGTLRCSWSTQKEKPGKPGNPQSKPNRPNRWNQRNQRKSWRVDSRKPRHCFVDRWSARRKRFAGCSWSGRRRRRAARSCSRNFCAYKERKERSWHSDRPWNRRYCRCLLQSIH